MNYDYANTWGINEVNGDLSIPTEIREPQKHDLECYIILLTKFVKTEAQFLEFWIQDIWVMSKDWYI